LIQPSPKKGNANIIVSNDSQKKLTNNLQSEQIKNTTLQKVGSATIDIEQIKKMYKMQQYINDMYDKKVKKQ